MVRSLVGTLCLAAICGEALAGRRDGALQDVPAEMQDNTPVTLSRRATCQNGVTGKVLNANGPMRAATVLKISPTTGKAVVTVLSRKDGSFIVPATPGETYSLVVRSYGHAPQNITWTALQAKAVPGCPYAYTTTFSLAALTFCNSSPCLNGGKCLQDENGYLCKCTPGFYPPTCNTTQPVVPIDGRNDRPCAENPCRNGGACTVNGTSYSCTCIIGFSGFNCEEQDTTVVPDYCFPNPCLNRGQCANLLGEVPYKCTCTADWIGPSCEAPAISSICDTNPCQNGGGCRRPFADPNKFVCLCPIGYRGQTCGEVIDFCNPNPCRSGGLCTRTRAGFFCTCQGGWEGKFCTIPPSVCLKNGPCKNGVCKVNPNTGAPICVCYNNYGGYFCDVPLTYPVTPCLVRDAAKSSTEISLGSVNIVLRDMSGKIYQRTSGPTQHGGFDWNTRKWIFFNFTYVESGFTVPAGTYVVIANAPNFRESVSSPFTVYNGWKGCPETVLRKLRLK